MIFKLLDQDKANHEVWGARIGAVACVGAMVASNWSGLPGSTMLAVGAAAAAGSAAAAGFLKERLDAKANAKAEAAGLEPAHSVERADAIATVQGGVAVALPLLAAFLLGQAVP